MYLDSEKGFTLVEMMIALILLSIGFMAVASMPVTVMMGNRTAQRLTEASFGAMDRIEQLMTLDNTEADLTPGNHSATVTEGGVTYTVNWNVTNLDASRKDVAVTVQWSDKGIAKEAQFAYRKTNFM
ncbi:type IV pilus modification PilV family protein [Thiovibrio sp. JS02]